LTVSISFELFVMSDVGKHLCINYKRLLFANDIHLTSDIS